MSNNEVTTGGAPEQDEREAVAAAENEGMQSRIGTNRVHPRDDVDSPVPPRSGVGTSAAGVEATQPPVAIEQGEDALADPRREPQAQAIATKVEEDAAGVRPTTSGEKKVKYVGLAGSYRDGVTGKVFRRNTPTTVSGDDAVRLTARRDFVSAD